MNCTPRASAPFSALATCLIIILGNAAAACAIVRVAGYPWRVAATLSVSLSQIGEFSFILSGLGTDLKLMPEAGRDLILAGAILSIIANPMLFALLDRLEPWIRSKDKAAAPPAPAAEGVAAPPPPPEPELPASTLVDHAVLVGYGRVGSLVGEDLIARGQPLLVIEERRQVVDALKKRGIEAILGNAGQAGLLEAANIARARWLISAIPNPFENANLVEHGRTANPGLSIIARAHSDDEVAYLKTYGADFIIVGETEIARGMSEHIAATLKPAAATG